MERESARRAQGTSSTARPAPLCRNARPPAVETSTPPGDALVGMIGSGAAHLPEPLQRRASGGATETASATDNGPRVSCSRAGPREHALPHRFGDGLTACVQDLANVERVARCQRGRALPGRGRKPSASRADRSRARAARCARSRRPAMRRRAHRARLAVDGCDRARRPGTTRGREPECTLDSATEQADGRRVLVGPVQVFSTSTVEPEVELLPYLLEDVARARVAEEEVPQLSPAPDASRRTAPGGLGVKSGSQPPTSRRFGA